MQERDRIIKELTDIVDEWIEKNIPKHENITTRRLGKLVRYLGVEHKAEIDKIVSMYSDHKTCPVRPSIRIGNGVEDGIDGLRRPDIWLLLWRCPVLEGARSPEETDIHDHLDSEVGVYVHKGEIEEEVYVFDRNKWKNGEERLRFQTVTRELGEGSTMSIPAPYVHLVRGVSDQDLSVSIHAYYPPLDEMNLFEKRGDELVRVGHWKEKRSC